MLESIASSKGITSLYLLLPIEKVSKWLQNFNVMICYESLKYQKKAPPEGRRGRSEKREEHRS